ncbi:ABC transporter substrate-binding protein [Leifsonia shinshuensis]|uniref:Peptide/nickel transport system substrate-binding protein n=1 Tax=Leifsonia shinshuensis TaxID=150026 RepID=A0A853D435_9MICO|nr:ABC transporter substrate-binding protein [Leifsonia shinshuensis]NYJ25770.1 peptide/nickel transport system substrate-binding protein [Leifsonia shinshuensis]
MTITAALTAVALCSIGLAGCSAGSAGSGDTLHVIRSESFDGWNPDSAAAYATYQTLDNVLEPLLKSNPDGHNVDAGIATKWSYDDAAKTWTFTLRPGVKFTDGTPVTPADVIFSAGVWAKGKNYGSLYGDIGSVTSPDAHTVVFHMTDTNTILPVLMTWSSSAIFPKDFGGKTEDAYWQKPIGAGAYAVDSWSTGGETVLSANPHYYEKIGAKRVVIDTVTDSNQAAAMLQSGQADISQYLAPQDASIYGSTLKALPSSQIEHLSFNTTHAALADLHVRKAIAYAIDYAAIVKGAFKGYGTPAKGIIPSGLANWSAPDVPGYTHDLEKAKAELAQATTKPASLEIVYDASNQSDNDVAQILKQDLAPLGIQLKLSPLETGAFLDRAYGLTADLTLWSYGAVSPDVVDPLAWISGTSWLFSGVKTDEVTAQFHAYASAPSAADKKGIIRQVQDDGITELPAAALAQFQVLYAVAARVHGFAPTPWGMYHWSDITLSGS